MLRIAREHTSKPHVNSKVLYECHFNSVIHLFCHILQIFVILKCDWHASRLFNKMHIKILYKGSSGSEPSDLPSAKSSLTKLTYPVVPAHFVGTGVKSTVNQPATVTFSILFRRMLSKTFNCFAGIKIHNACSISLIYQSRGEVNWLQAITIFP